MNKYHAPNIKGETVLAVDTPAEISFDIAANAGPSFFNIHREKGGAGTHAYVVDLVAPNGNVIESIDGSTKGGSRQLGSNQPHFQCVGKPRTTPTNLDHELEPGTYVYRISAADGKAVAGVVVGRFA